MRSSPYTRPKSATTVHTTRSSWRRGAGLTIGALTCVACGGHSRTRRNPTRVNRDEAPRDDDGAGATFVAIRGNDAVGIRRALVRIVAAAVATRRSDSAERRSRRRLGAGYKHAV